MKQAVCLVFLALCAAALGFEDWKAEKEEGWEAAPKPCCGPAQWEGNFGEFTAYYSRRHHHPGLAVVGGRMSYDGKSKKVAVTIGMPKRPPFKIILDFSQQKRYLIFNNGTKCKVSKTSRSFKPACIPKTAKFLGAFYQGAGKSKLNENAWLMEVKREVNKVEQCSFHVTLTTTKTGCVPVGESVIGHARGTLVASGIGYSGFTGGIKDPKVFTPPKSCKKVDEDDHFFGEDYPILEYFKEKFHE